MTLQPDRPDEASAWTLPSAIKYLDTKIELYEATNLERFKAAREEVAAAIMALKDAIAAAMAAAKEAVTKSEVSSDKRFDLANETKAAMADQQRMLSTKAEVEGLKSEVNFRLTALSDRLDKAEKYIAGEAGEQLGRSGSMDQLWRALPVIVSMFALALAVAVFLK